jgi:DNA-binding transcriptional ArsR family regulator
LQPRKTTGQGGERGVSAIHRALADTNRREVLIYLRASGDITTLGDLAHHLADMDDTSVDAAMSALYHSTLPALAKSKFVTYDLSSELENTYIQYRGGSYPTEVLETSLHDERS